MGEATDEVRSDPGASMRAVGVSRPGSIDSLQPLQAPKPVRAPGQLRISVSAAAVNPADVRVVRGELVGRLLHARVSPLIPGFDFSGVVVEPAEGEDELRSGDEVFGFLAYASANRQGTFAEQITIDPGSVARKPPGVSHEIAAAAATPGLTALQSLRDLGRLKSGGRVLIVGAAGGVGVLAIGIARRLGASVTAVCSTPAVELVRELGAEDVIDRRKQDPLTAAGPYDVVFDAAAAHSYASARHLLSPSGAYVTTLPGPGLAVGKLMAAFSSRRCEFVAVKSRRRDLEQLGSWLDDGLRVPIHARFPAREAAKALHQLDRGGVHGRLAIDVATGL